MITYAEVTWFSLRGYHKEGSLEIASSIEPIDGNKTSAKEHFTTLAISYANMTSDGTVKSWTVEDSEPGQML